MEHYIPIKDATGKVAQIGIVAVEITEKKKLEESLREEKKRQQVMVEVSHILTAKRDVPQAFPQISAYLRRVLRQEYAALAVQGFSPAEMADWHCRNHRKGSWSQGPAGTRVSDFQPGPDARLPSRNQGLLVV